MSLKDLNLKISYDSNENDVLNEFYVPVLSNSIKYKRIVGFFSSSSLAVAACGISKFIVNNGYMQLICGAKLSSDDLNMIKNAYMNPKELIEDKMLEELEHLENEFIKDHVRALGWMIANHKLKIKIAILLDKFGNPLEDDKGMLHQKVGILEDQYGNKLSFSGSNNETAFAWRSNIEEFKVFRSWKRHEKEYLNADLNKFRDYWNGKAKKMRVIDVPTAITNKLIKIAPNKFEDLKLDKYYKKRANIQKRVELWDYQKEAIKNWEKNQKKGIFEMATGTGKTFTALGCLDTELHKSEKLLTVITAPYQHLVQQWKKSIENFGIKCKLVIADSSNRSWKDDLVNLLLDISLGNVDKGIILTTHLTFSSNKFMEILINYADKYDIFLIADEVHGLGAKHAQYGFINNYRFRLGLSATPKRWFDDYGTDRIYEYFGGVVYEFNLQKAINTINPATKKTYLTPYIYKTKFLNLENRELEDYIEITRSIAVRYGINKSKKNEKILESLLFKRANIIKNAQGKYKVLEEILETIGQDLKWTIIYCTETQIKGVMNILQKKRIPGHLFTMNEGTKPESKLNGLSEREFILKQFSEGYYKVLVAIKCLDEGVDIPPARIAIIMASSGNPREYIQRLGRVIRRYKGKEKAIIYDLFVLPNLNKIPVKFKDFEKKIFKKELGRYEELAKIAVNNAEALDNIYNVKYRF